MRWERSHRFDPRAVALADRHYSRQQPGTPQFVAPHQNVVFLTPEADALWVTSYPRPEYVKHAWPDAWVCSWFRNESRHLSSELIGEAVAATRALWGDPPAGGIITFVDAGKVRPKRDPGYCYVRAGWTRLDAHTKGGLIVLRQLPHEMPAAAAPLGEMLLTRRAA